MGPQGMQRQEMNGWLVYSWGQTLKVIVLPSPWESELMLTVLRPEEPGVGENVFTTLMLPADPDLTVADIQKMKELTIRRAEGLHSAFQDALRFFYDDDEDDGDDGDAANPPPTIIPIVAVN